MNRIDWQPATDIEVSGTVGSLRYLVRSPAGTPGWRVWLHFNHGMASIGGLLITVRARDMEDAKQVAEYHFRNFIRDLGYRPERITELLEANNRYLERAREAEAALNSLAEAIQDAYWNADHSSATGLGEAITIVNRFKPAPTNKPDA